MPCSSLQIPSTMPVDGSLSKSKPIVSYQSLVVGGARKATTIVTRLAREIVTDSMSSGMQTGDSA